MMSDRKLATMMLNAVWDEDVRSLRRVFRMEADPSWVFNGYPILVHAVFTRNEKIMMLLIRTGAVQVEEALGFVLDRYVGEMIFSPAFPEIMPREKEVKEEFGPYLSWYCPLDYSFPARAWTGRIMEQCVACIRILQLLRSREFVMREELTQKLDTSVKNILGYHKELEEARYVIEGTAGKCGGHQLKSRTFPPVVGLHKEELCSLQGSRRYLESRRDSLLYTTYYRATNEFLATTTLQVRESGVYVEENADVTGAIISMIRIYERGRDAPFAVELQYKSLHASNFETTVIQPCEITDVKGSYYCPVYSLKARAYRSFKFGEERMWNIRLTRCPFIRDVDFYTRDYVGKTGLIRDEIIELKLYVHEESTRLISEKKPGISPILEWVDEQILYLTTMTEGKISTRNFPLSLGNQCQLVNPQDPRQEIHAIAKDMLALYSQFLLHLV